LDTTRVYLIVYVTPNSFTPTPSVIPSIAQPSDKPLGYLTKQESVAVQGVPNLLIRSLLDKQQFYDPEDAALDLGISSAFWSLFGLLWPSGSHLAERMALRPVNAHERILEIGCGLALSSLVGHRRGANITASDCHPLAGAFLKENLRLNNLAPMAYRHGHWGQHNDQQKDATVDSKFDLIIGSDILYERDERGDLAHYINDHMEDHAEVWVVDPNRGNRAHFHRNMAAQGFTLSEETLKVKAKDSETAYQGRMLTYSRD
jgi:predicted nicotinamide N-methyase